MRWVEVRCQHEKSEQLISVRSYSIWIHLKLYPPFIRPLVPVVKMCRSDLLHLDRIWTHRWCSSESWLSNYLGDWVRWSISPVEIETGTCCPECKESRQERSTIYPKLLEYLTVREAWGPSWLDFPWLLFILIQWLPTLNV